MEVDKDAIKAALRKRKAYILDNLDTMTMKQCRTVLEQDMGLPPKALAPHKDFIERVVDRLVVKHKGGVDGGAPAAPATGGGAPAAPASPPAPASAARTPAAAAEPAGEREPDAVDEEESESEGEGGAPASEEEDDDEDEAPRRRAAGKKERRKEGRADGRPAKKHRSAPEPKKPAGGPKQYSKRVEAARRVCRAAGVTIPPAIYVKNKADSALEDAFDALLEKHGLARDSDPSRIARVKARLEKEKDLEGIDVSNILEGGRRRRVAAQPVNYRAVANGASDDDEGEGEDGGEDEGDGGSSSASDSEQAFSDAEEGSEEERGGRRKGGARRRPADSDEEDAGSDGEGSSGGGGKRAARSAKPSSAPQKRRAAQPAVAASDSDEEQDNRGRGQLPASGHGKGGSAGKPAARTGAQGDSGDEGERHAPAGVPKARRAVLADWSDDE